jgi:hypothetical protein
MDETAVLSRPDTAAPPAHLEGNEVPRVFEHNGGTPIRPDRSTCSSGPLLLTHQGLERVLAIYRTLSILLTRAARVLAITQEPR